jgi:hypothetical protein
LSVFRAQNMGRLPEEQQNNYQQLTALQAQKLNLNMSMNRVNQERLLYENQLRIYRGQLVSLKDRTRPSRRPSGATIIGGQRPRNRAVRGFARHRAGALQGELIPMCSGW